MTINIKKQLFPRKMDEQKYSKKSDNIMGKSEMKVYFLFPKAKWF